MPPEDIWQSLEKFWGGSYWYLIDRGQACCSASYNNAQQMIHYPVSAVLRNPGFEGSEAGCGLELWP